MSKLKPLAFKTIFFLIITFLFFSINLGSLFAYPEGFRLPFEGNAIIDTDSSYHKGGANDAIDFKGLVWGESKICATEGGIVVFAGEDTTGYGNLVKIEHANGYVSYYGHLSEIFVYEGEPVVQGEVIGLVGNSGNVVVLNPNSEHPGTHLHFHVEDINKQPIYILDLPGINGNNATGSSVIQISEQKLSLESTQTAEQSATPTEKNFFGVIGDWFSNLWNNIVDVITVEAAETPSNETAIIAASQESQSEIQGSVTTETIVTIPTPSKPSLKSPYNWYQSLGGAPTLIWEGDENSAQYYVVVNSSNTGDIESGWISATSWKPNLPNENYIYSWKVKAKNSQGVESEWSENRNFSIASTTLKFEGDISFSPPSPSSADKIKIFASTTGWGGVGVTLRVSVNTAQDGSSNGEWRILKELGVPKFNEVDAPEWNTKGWQNGTYRIRVEAKGPDDPNWLNPAVIEATYTLVNKSTELMGGTNSTTEENSEVNSINFEYSYGDWFQQQGVINETYEIKVSKYDNVIFIYLINPPGGNYDAYNADFVLLIPSEDLNVWRNDRSISLVDYIENGKSYNVNKNGQEFITKVLSVTFAEHYGWDIIDHISLQVLSN